MGRLLHSVVGRSLGVGVAVALLAELWFGAFFPLPAGADHPVDESLGVAVTSYASTGALADHLTRLQTRWWYEFNWQSTSDSPGFTKVELLRACGPTGSSSQCTRPSVAGVQQRAQQKPGRSWMLGNEPNTVDQDNLSPAQYAAFLYTYGTALKQADPTAKLVAPNVLNSTVLCQDCAGRADSLGGGAYTQQMWTAYTAAYSNTAYATPDALVDVWAMHAYQINWGGVAPWVDAAWVQNEIAHFRGTLTGLGVSQGKPLWVTEWASLLGFACYTTTGGGVRFDCPYDDGAVNQFITSMVNWFRTTGRTTHNVQRSFLYANWADPEYWQMQPAQRTASVRLYESAAQGATLSPQGALYSSLVGFGQAAHVPTPVPEATATPIPTPTPVPEPPPPPAPAPVTGAPGGGGGGRGGGSIEPAPVAGPSPTSPLPSLSSSASVPVSGGTLQPSQGGLIIAIPAGALSQPATFTYQPVPEPPAPRGLARPLLSFELTAATSAGQPIATFAKPLEIAVSYRAASLLGVSELTLRVEAEVSPGEWQALQSTVDTEAKIVHAQTMHLSTFALVGEQGYTVVLPALLKAVPSRGGRGPGG